MSRNLGRKHTTQELEKMRLSQLGEKSHRWKGDEVSYICLHKWLRRNIPKPEGCENCNRKVQLDLANVTDIYNRDFKNWKYLCRSCHMVQDGRMEKLMVINVNRKHSDDFKQRQREASIKRVRDEFGRFV
jgi:ribosomal protein L36